MKTLFQVLCEGAGMGEKLRVVLRYQDNLPLGKDDADILDGGLGTTGEYIESMRRYILKIAKMTLTDEEFEAFPQAVKDGVNEGTTKP